MIIVVEILGLVMFLGIVIVYTFLAISSSYRQFTCNHDGGVNETRACDAICKLCGKNLGFIGTEENKVRRSQ